MSSVKAFWVIVLFFSSFFSVFAQVKLGEWRAHLPYRHAKTVVDVENKVFCLTESGLFSYALSDNEIKVYGKASGLSESDISTIAWSSETKGLVIAYESGNVDILSDKNIINIPDLKNFKLVGSKNINSIFCLGKLAYLATDFAIVVLNLEKNEVADTYYIGQNGSSLHINDISSYMGYLYAATGDGLYVADIDSYNLADYNNWSRVSEMPEASVPVSFVESHDGFLSIARNNSETESEIFTFDGMNWKKLSGSYGRINALRNFGGDSYWVENKKINALTQSGISSFSLAGMAALRDLVILESGRIFVADYYASLKEKGDEASVLIPDGASGDRVNGMLSRGDEVWTIAPSQISENSEIWNVSFNDGSYWTHNNETNTSGFSGISKFTAIESGEANDPLYLGSSDGTIFYYSQDVFEKKWSPTNSPISSNGVADLGFDIDRNLWVLDANSHEGIKVLTQAEDWQSLYYSQVSNRDDLQKILCLKNHDKWVLRSSISSLFAFNVNGSLSNVDDDPTASFNVRDKEGNVLLSDLNDLVEDLEGRIWLGGDKGVAVYSNPGNLFREGDFYASRPVISINGSTQYLLSSEQVNAIAVDGANQKWFGTENSGAFLISGNADEQLLHFNKENSLLPSNTIEKIVVNDETGEVYFATDKGLVSYQNSVTSAEENYSELYVYPNPVRETYRGNITVSGLMTDSTIKICNLTGNLVMDGNSSGGQFVWDGKNFNGSRVSTGIYLIFCSNDDGSEAKVLKLLFIN